MRAQVCQPARSQSTGMQTSFHRKAVPEASTAAAAQCHAGCLSTALGAANHHHRSTIAAGSKVTGRRCLTPHAHQAAAAHSICSSPSSSPDTAGSSGPTADAHSKDAGNAVSDSNSTDDSTDDSTDTGTTVKARIYPKLGKLSYRMIVSYDGTAYSGWQLQSRARTIQGEIERALSTVLREDRQTLCVCAAGRTDAGVHAVGQVRHVCVLGSSPFFLAGDGVLAAAGHWILLGQLHGQTKAAAVAHVQVCRDASRVLSAIQWVAEGVHSCHIHAVVRLPAGCAVYDQCDNHRPRVPPLQVELSAAARHPCVLDEPNST